MADRGRGVKICDDKCGCTVPCNGGNTCRCSGSESGGGDHTTCPCGDHCSCNPCGCPKAVAAGAGCKCGSDCSCASCRT